MSTPIQTERRTARYDESDRESQCGEEARMARVCIVPPVPARPADPLPVIRDTPVMDAQSSSVDVVVNGDEVQPSVGVATPP